MYTIIINYYTINASNFLNKIIEPNNLRFIYLEDDLNKIVSIIFILEKKMHIILLHFRLFLH